MYRASDYTYRVFWSHDDEEFVGTCAEFPLLSYVGNDPTETLNGIIEVVEGALDILAEEGKEIPIPLGTYNFTGHFPLRMPPELHRVLAIEAAEQKVSLNRLITERLAAGITTY